MCTHTHLHKHWSQLSNKTTKKSFFFYLSVLVLFLCLPLPCSHFAVYCPTLLSFCHYFHLFPFPHPSFSTPLALLPSTDIVMLLCTTLSRLKRWSHEWSLQFKSTQPSRCMKWIFCIYSCNNDSIWGYYLQTVAEFSAALIMVRQGQYHQDEKCIYSVMFRMNWHD